MHIVDELIATVANHRFSSGGEKLLQNDIETMLTALGADYQREAQLGLGRVDFLVEGVAIELKISGTPMNVALQLDRYAQSDQVSELVLMTTSHRHRRAFPPTIRGKRLRVIRIPTFL